MVISLLTHCVDAKSLAEHLLLSHPTGSTTSFLERKISLRELENQKLSFIQSGGRYRLLLARYKSLTTKLPTPEPLLKLPNNTSCQDSVKLKSPVVIKLLCNSYPEKYVLTDSIKMIVFFTLSHPRRHDRPQTG